MTTPTRTTTTDPTTPIDPTTAPTSEETTELPSRREVAPAAPTVRGGVGRATWVVAGGALVATAIAVGVMTQGGSPTPEAPVVTAGPMSVEALAAAGSIPAEALQPARPTDEQWLESLAAAGTIPAEALEAGPPTHEEWLQALVDAGTIPAEALASTTHRELFERLAASGSIPAATLAEAEDEATRALLERLVESVSIPAGTLEPAGP